eukprot:7514382-Pyramimonas_sp.AAC.1
MHTAAKSGQCAGALGGGAPLEKPRCAGPPSVSKTMHSARCDHASWVLSWPPAITLCCSLTGAAVVPA